MAISKESPVYEFRVSVGEKSTFGGSIGGSRGSYMIYPAKKEAHPCIS